MSILTIQNLTIQPVIRIFGIFISTMIPSMTSYAQNVHLDRLKIADGFSISVYADGIPDARSMTLGPKGTLFVGNRKNNRVWAVLDTNNDNKADKSLIIADGLTSPNGVAIFGDDLYVAERSRIIRFKNIESTIGQQQTPEVVRDNFPKDISHGWKYIAFGPDGYLYVPIGAPCNVCLKSNSPQYATITRMKPDGSDFSIFAHGVRNSVGFDWHPVTKHLWFTDNGRDRMGDDIPADELNHAPVAGIHFGFPFCHEGAISDPVFGKEKSCADFSPPVQKLGAHVAALGMKFYTGTMFPSKYKNQIFIAEHGSWNRSSKVGYRIMVVNVNNDQATSYEVFAQGWMENETAWGRPVDILIMPDGALLVSDDLAGVIYRISYSIQTD